MIRAGALIVALLAAGAVSADEPVFKAERLPASGLKAGDQFGSAVAVGAGTIAVGAYLADGGRGAVYLFTREGAGWSQERLPGGPGEWFGFDLAFERDGKTLIIGAPSPGKVGKVYIRDDKGLRPVAGGAAGDEFGSSVSIDDGWIAVGARGANQRAGAVYVLRLGSTVPIFLPVELPGPSSKGELGQSVSLKGDTLAAGAPLRGEDRSSPGAVYLSKRTGEAWAPLLPVPGPGLNAGSAFGYAVAVQNKDRIVVGAPLASPGGAAYTCNGTGCDPYLQGGKDDQMGVAVAADDKSIVVGARGTDGNLGAVYRDKARLSREGVRGPELGFGVAVRGLTIVAGAFREGGTGAAYVFEPDTPACDPRVELTSPEEPLTTSESGASLKFTVKLTCKPASPVPVTISDPSEAKVEPSSLLTHGEVTVTGREDAECDGPREYSLQVGDKEAHITNLDNDVCVGRTEEVCVTPDGIAIFEVLLRNTGAGRLEDGTANEDVIELPDDVRVVTATTNRGVVTVDHLENTVAWNGSLPVGGEALVTILAPLEPALGSSEVALAYEPCE